MKTHFSRNGLISLLSVVMITSATQALEAQLETGNASQPNAKFASLSKITRAETSPRYHMVYRLDRTVYVDDRITYSLEGMAVKHWLAYWRGLPEVPFTRIRSERGSFMVDNGQVKSMPLIQEEGDEKRPLFKVDTEEPASAELAVQDLATVDIYEGKLVDGPPDSRVADLSEDKVKLYTKYTKTYDYESSQVQNWIKKHRLEIRSGESDIDFAYRVSVFMRSHVTYDTKPPGDPVASSVCTRMYGECAQQAILVTAVLRASNIPTRTVCCRWVAGSVPIKDAGGHVWNIFWAKGVGWVPFDVTTGELKDRFGHSNPALLPRMLDFDFQLAGYDGKIINEFALDAFLAWYPRGDGNASKVNVTWSGSVRVKKHSGGDWQEVPKRGNTSSTP